MKEKVKIGYVGFGRRGFGIIKYALVDMKDVEISALCEIDPDKAEAATRLLTENGRPAPKLYTDYNEMLKDPDLDAIMLMIGWNGRIQYAIDAMKAGKYVGIEVGCAFDLSECYALVEAYEQTGVPVMMLENCCYGRREMMALRMVKEGLFGEIIQCCGAYRHNLFECDLFVKKEDGTVDTNHYRLAEYANRNCEQYPTHELGPISKLLNLNRGNRMLSLRSFSTKSAGIEAYMKDHVPADHPFAGKKFRQGDLVTTIIDCAGGEQIVLTHDTTLPRPYYSRSFTVRGTKGMCEEAYGGASTFYLEGMEEGPNNFNNEKEFFEKYDHPLHAEYVEQTRGGHGGMDWLVLRAFVESVKHGMQTSIDVYDTALWLSIGPLSEASISCGGAPVAVPDFTKGKWFRREPAIASKYSLDLICSDPDTPIVP